MSIAVEHDKRKQEILEKALDVFVGEGYEDTTFQKIAERCGITRTILYLYFKNKREIFSFSIKLFTARLEGEIRAIGSDRALSQADKLSKIAELAVDQCGKNRRLLAVVLDYLGHLRTSGGDPDERVRRRTIRMRHIIAGLLIEGVDSGEFKHLSIKAADDLIYAIVEATIFRIAVLGRKESNSLVESARLFAFGLRDPAWKPPLVLSASSADGIASSGDVASSGNPAAKGSGA